MLQTYCTMFLSSAVLEGKELGGLWINRLYYQHCGKTREKSIVQHASNGVKQIKSYL